MRDGWEEDEWSLDGDDKFDDNDTSVTKSPMAKSPEGAVVKPEATSATSTLYRSTSPAELALEKYVMCQLRSYSLEFTTNAAALRDALNQTLHQKFHNNDSALHDLTAYYQAKPALYEYTLQKELPRMKYRVVMRSPTSEKATISLDSIEEIRTVFLSNKRKYQQQPLVDLLWRAANQSLLADALSILTSPTGVVRPQFFSTAVAHQVSFLVDLVQGFINCDATLNVSIPSGSAISAEASRVTIAEVRLNIIYSPAIHCQMHQHQPMLQCYITDVTAGSLLRNDPARYFIHLQDAARTLSRDWIELGYSEPGIESLMDELHYRQHTQHQPQFHPKQQMTRNNLFSTSAQALREALLHPDTQQAIYQASLMAKDAASKTNTGIASALKQLDSATGISTKVKLFGNIRLLPTAEDILEGEQEERVARNKQNMSQAALSDDLLLHPTTTTVPLHKMPSSRQKSGSTNAPLLGGLLMSGLSRMARSVSQPEDVTFPRPPPSPQKSETVQLNTPIPKQHRSAQTSTAVSSSSQSIFSGNELEEQHSSIRETGGYLSEKNGLKSRNKQEKEGWSDTELDVDSGTEENEELAECSSEKVPDSNDRENKVAKSTLSHVASLSSHEVAVRRHGAAKPTCSTEASASDTLVPTGSCTENSSVMSSSLYSSSSSSSDFLHVISASNTVWKSVEKDLTHNECDDDFGETRKRWVHPLSLATNSRGRPWFVS